MITLFFLGPTVQGPTRDCKIKPKNEATLPESSTSKIKAVSYFVVVFI